MDHIAPFISAITSLIQAAALVVATWVAALGLSAWRRQLVGGKRVELAEDALVAAHDVYDAVREVRNAFIFGDEGSSRKPEEGETPELKRLLDSYFVPIERLRTVSNRFEKLRALRTRCRVHFGEDVTPHFNKLAASEIRIASAAQFQIKISRDIHPQNYEQHEEKRELMKQSDSVVRDRSKLDSPDEFSQDLLDALKSLEKLLKPHINDT